MRLPALLLAVALGTWGCHGFGPHREDAELRVGVQGDITGLYPKLRNEAYTFAVNANLYEGLTAFGHDLGPQPALSDGWENPDEHTWIFHLRPGVRFSDGQPVRASDVVASLRHAMAAGATRTLLDPVASVEATPNGQVRIRTRFPCPVLLAHLAFAYVVPESALAVALPPNGAPGTGPFVVESWQPGHELVLGPNPQFRGTRPEFTRVRLLVLSDPKQRLLALDSGRVDIVDNLPTPDIERLRHRSDLRVVSRPGLRVVFLVLRVEAPPFADPLVREAIDLALDRDELVKRALDGFGAPASQLVPPPVLGYNPDLKPTRVDRERARDLLRKAHLPAGFAVRLDGPTDRYPAGEAVLAEVTRQLAEIGVKVEAAGRPKQEFFKLVDSGRYQFLLYAWSCETVQAGEALDELIHTPPTDEGGNVANFSDPAIDRLIDAANRSSSLLQRGALLGEAMAAVTAVRPVLPLAVLNESFAFRTERVAWEPSVDMALHPADVHRGGR